MMRSGCARRARRWSRLRPAPSAISRPGWWPAPPQQLDLEGLQLLIIENVGNLVCPASYDLGEDLRVVLLSVTEGEDKPLKYPPIFQAADVVVISKMDLAAACGYDRELALGNLRRIAPGARVFETSARTGQGMEDVAQVPGPAERGTKGPRPARA